MVVVIVVVVVAAVVVVAVVVVVVVVGKIYRQLRLHNLYHVIQILSLSLQLL